MRKMWFSAILCLLYLSASTLFASHHHSDDTLQGHVKCAACAWHSDTVTDEPVMGIAASAPEFLMTGHVLEIAPGGSIFLSSPSNRGPPLFVV